MKHKARLFYIGIEPETQRKTIRLEIVVDDEQFDFYKDCWCNGDIFHIEIQER